MARPSKAEIEVRYNNCHEITDNIEPLTIKKTDKGNFRISVTCAKCGKWKHKQMNKAQLDLMPPEIINAPNGSVFNNTYNKTEGGALPILPILGKIAIPLISAVAPSVIGAVGNKLGIGKKDEDPKKKNLKKKKIL